MAFSGYYGTSNQYIVYWIDVNVKSQDINANTSSVDVIVKAKRTNSGYSTYGNGTVYCRANGQVLSETMNTGTVITSDERLLLAKNITVGHNDDGTKTIHVSAWINHNMFSSSEQGFDVTLPTIPRKSTYDITNTSPEAGSQVGVSIHRASSSFRHTFNLCIGGSVYTLADKADGDWLTLTIPTIIIRDYCSNSTSCQGTLWCDTYNGNNKLGCHGVGITITVPNLYQPSYTSLDVTRIDNGVPSEWNCYVKGISKAKIDITGATGSEGSTIKNYWINANNETFTTSSATTNVLTSAGTMTIKGTIKDSRGRSVRKTKYITVVDYYPPNLTNVVVNRSEGSKIDEVNGEYIYVKASFDYAKVNGNNSATMYIKWKKTTDSTWSTPIALQPDSFHILGSGKIDLDCSWDVMVYVTDQFNTVGKTFILPTAKTTLDLLAGGKGIAFGKVAENEGFECDMNTTFNNDVAIRNDSDVNIMAHLGCDPYGFLINKDIEDMYYDGEEQVVFKFGNGMMVIIQKYSTTADIESSWNGIYTQGGSQNDLPDFSEPFTTPPIVQMSACSTSGHTLWLMRNTPPSTSNAGSYELASGTSATNIQAQINVLTIGRWK